MNDKSGRQQDVSFLIRTIRICGVVFCFLGGVIYMDAFGIAATLQITEDGLHRVLGPVLFLVGILDVILVPQFLEKIMETRAKKNKERS